MEESSVKRENAHRFNCDGSMHASISRTLLNSMKLTFDLLNIEQTNRFIHVQSFVSVIV